MGEYGQFCPVAKAAEILDQRWTLLVVRELVAGSTRFNDIHRGVPRMSRSLLSQRLTTLVHLGILDRRADAGGPRYELTASGRELEPIVDALGQWGVRRMSALSEHDHDPALLIWDMHRRVDHAALPDGRTTLRIRFPDVVHTLRDWWLVMTADEVDICESDPGYGDDVVLETPIGVLVRVWRGDLPWEAAYRDGLLLKGPQHLRRDVVRWFLLSPFAATPRELVPGSAGQGSRPSHDAVQGGIGGEGQTLDHVLEPEAPVERVHRVVHVGAEEDRVTTPRLG